MAIGGLPLFDALKARMSWHHARQKVLAENVANSDMPGYRPLDVKPPAAASGGLQMVRTASGHIPLGGVDANNDPGRQRRFETTPSGNGVNLEDEMMKVAQNNQDYQLAATLYQKSLGLMKTAIGRR